MISGPGAGEALAALDRRIRDLAVRHGAEEWSVPDGMAADTLARAEHFAAFPGIAVPLDDGSGRFWPPAACYHLYQSLLGGRLQRPLSVTCVCRCARNEKSYGSARLRVFTMREVVFIGPAGHVEHERRRWMELVLGFAGALGLDAGMDAASDPFFGPTWRGKKLIQQARHLKFELHVPIVEGEGRIAISSFNLHEEFFGSRFGFTLDGEPAHSACVGFGLERWLMALVARHGRAAAFRICSEDS